MELTPEVLRTVTFKEQWRGVSPSQVDEFLERVAIAVGQLLERLRQAEERATQAEARLQQERGQEDELRRTLVLAQRTANAAIEEARAEAASILADADSRADAAMVAAEARIARLESEMAERHEREVGVLAERRRALEADIEALTSFVNRERGRLRQELARQIEVLDATLAVGAPPSVSPVEQAPGAGASLDEVRQELADALRRAESGTEPAAVEPETTSPDAEPQDDDDFLRVLQQAMRAERVEEDPSTT